MGPALRIAGGTDAAGGDGIRQAINDACEYLAFLNPSLATLVRTIAHLPAPTSGHTAYALPFSCHYGPKFAALPLPQRAGIVVHEFAHVSLAHHARRATIARLAGGADAETFNIAADLVINTWIKTIADTNRMTIDLPADTINADTLQMQASVAGLSFEDSPTAMRRAVTTYAGLATHSTETVHTILSEMAGGKGGGMKGLAAMAGDLKEEDRGEDGQPANRNQEERDAQGKRIAHAIGQMAGSDSWRIAERIRGELPRPAVDWRRHLRDMMVRECSDDVESTWRRVSRRQPSMPAGIGPLPGLRRIETGNPVAIIDTSGSISDETVERFMAECLCVANMVGRPVTVIEADTEPARVSQMKPGSARHRPLMNAGRGGTVFGPALRLAAKMDPSVIVYLTDLCAPEPDYRPKAPTIWCAVGDQAPPSFGRVVRVPKNVHGA